MSTVSAITRRQSDRQEGGEGGSRLHCYGPNENGAAAVVLGLAGAFYIN